MRSTDKHAHKGTVGTATHDGDNRRLRRAYRPPTTTNRRQLTRALSVGALHIRDQTNPGLARTEGALRVQRPTLRAAGAFRGIRSLERADAACVYEKIAADVVGPSSTSERPTNADSRKPISPARPCRPMLVRLEPGRESSSVRRCSLKSPGAAFAGPVLFIWKP